MKKSILVTLLCFTGMLFCSSVDVTHAADQECCCQMTCNYVRALLGSPTTKEVDQCWDLTEISSCDEDTACLAVSNNFLTYTNEWSGAGCRVQDKCIVDIFLGSDNPKIYVLKAFRDEVLSQTPEGRELIALYYAWSPFLVEAMQQDEQLKEEIKGMIEMFFPVMKEEAP